MPRGVTATTNATAAAATPVLSSLVRPEDPTLGRTVHLERLRGLHRVPCGVTATNATTCPTAATPVLPSLLRQEDPTLGRTKRTVHLGRLRGLRRVPSTATNAATCTAATLTAATLTVAAVHLAFTAAAVGLAVASAAVVPARPSRGHATGSATATPVAAFPLATGPMC